MKLISSTMLSVVKLLFVRIIFVVQIKSVIEPSILFIVLHTKYLWESIRNFVLIRDKIIVKNRET